MNKLKYELNTGDFYGIEISFMDGYNGFIYPCNGHFIYEESDPNGYPTVAARIIEKDDVESIVNSRQGGDLPFITIL